MPDRILVLIPCYNCALQIPRVLAQFQSKISAYVETILVLDNGSTDGTRDAAIAAAQNLPGLDIRVARNRQNFNLGGSHKAAFSFALRRGYSHVMVLHGDDQAQVMDILPLLEKKLHRKYDACLGSRFSVGSKLRGYSTFRITGNRVFNTLFSWVLHRRVEDLGAGLNIFSARVMRSSRIVRYSDDLRFNIFLFMGMFEENLPVIYFPISWREDDQLSNVRMTSQAWRTLKILWQRMVSPVGFWLVDQRTVRHDEYRFDVIFPSTSQGVA